MPAAPPVSAAANYKACASPRSTAAPVKTPPATAPHMPPSPASSSAQMLLSKVSMHKDQSTFPPPQTDPRHTPRLLYKMSSHVLAVVSPASPAQPSIRQFAM